MFDRLRGGFGGGQPGGGSSSSRPPIRGIGRDVARRRQRTTHRATPSWIAGEYTTDLVIQPVERLGQGFVDVVSLRTKQL
jgi:hypothetical protein